MKDNLSLIAAAAGGFILSMAAAGIIQAAPVTSLMPHPTTTPMSDLSLQQAHVSARRLQDSRP